MSSHKSEPGRIDLYLETDYFATDADNVGIRFL